MRRKTSRVRANQIDCQKSCALAGRPKTVRLADLLLKEISDKYNPSVCLSIVLTRRILDDLNCTDLLSVITKTA